VRDLSLALELIPFQRPAFDLVRTLGKAREERFRRQFVEWWLVALEEYFSQALTAQSPADADLENAVLVLVFNLQFLPCIAIDQGMYAEIAVRVVEFEEDLGFFERDFFLILFIGKSNGCCGYTNSEARVSKQMTLIHGWVPLCS
jgi:hypothetical protein